VGLDGPSIINAAGDSVHNILLEVLLGSGLVGLVGILLMLGAIFRAALGMLARPDSGERRLAVALFSAFIAFFVFGMAAPVLLSRYAWVPAAMLMILHQLRPRVATAPDIRQQESTGQTSRTE
jgi:O-antigen ligase